MFPESWSPKQCKTKVLACRKNAISIYGRVHEIALKDLHTQVTLTIWKFLVSFTANSVLGKLLFGRIEESSREHKGI